MEMKKIMLVFGTRPEAIKMAPVVKELKRRADRFSTIVTVTGQHRQMLDQVLRIFNITPDFDLDIMKPGQDLTDVTTGVLQGMKQVLAETKPDLVLVHGDTSTSTAAALAAFYAQIPVGHVEAGLRTGNTVIDALVDVTDRINNDPAMQQALADSIKEAGYDTGRLADESRRMVLITGHRRENFGEGFLSMCRAIKALSEQFPQVDFVYPMHLNPNVRRPIHEIFGENLNIYGNLFFIEPLEYLDFVFLMGKSSIVLTDSGGIQEEAPGLGKPVLVMRDTTERPEAVDAGTVRLVGTDFEKITTETTRLLTDRDAYEQMSRASNPYGDGHASERIADTLARI